MVALTPTERRIYDAVLKRPRSANELRDIVWFDDPNGGPSEKTVHVHVHNLRKRLHPIGLTVECRPSDDGRSYRIKSFPGNLPAHKEFDRAGIYPG